MNIKRIEKKYIGDIVLCSVLVLLSVLFFIFRLFPEMDNFDNVTLFCNGQEIHTFSLSENEDYFGIDGTVISVSSGKVFIKSTDCPDKTCQRMYPITSSGGSIVCVPKKLVLKDVDKGSAFDTVVG